MLVGMRRPFVLLPTHRAKCCTMSGAPGVVFVLRFGGVEFGVASWEEDGDGSAVVGGVGAGFQGNGAAVFLDDALRDP